MKKIRRLLNKKDGTTLVETIVTMLLISIMFAMAATALSSAAKVFVREQRLQYAQSILDTTMTELRGIVENADGYIKIYDVERKKNQKITDKTGNNSGNILEFINGDGYAVLISADGCEKTQLFIGRQESGEADAVDEGQLLTRYYFYNNGTYQYTWNDEPAARAVATVFGKGFYMAITNIFTKESMRNVRKIIRIKKQKTQRQQEERIYSGRADRSSGNPCYFSSTFNPGTDRIH